MYDRGDTWYSQDQNDAVSDCDGHKYRPDCSGLVAMAWHLPKKSDGWDLDTDNFHSYSKKSWLGSLHDLLPGDALLKDGHMELFERWVDAGDHTRGAWVYSENTYGQKTNHNVNSWGEMTSYRGIRYDNIIDAPTGTASIYGVLDGGRLTYSAVDVRTGRRTHGAVVSTATLGFQPVAMATLNFNTVLVTSPAGQLYRVDVITNNESLVFNAPVALGGGWTHRLLLGTTDGGELLSYRINGAGDWDRHELRSSTWQVFDHLLSPGGGVYFGHKANGALLRYVDANPFDGADGDLSNAMTVDDGGWSQVLLSAQPNMVT